METYAKPSRARIMSLRESLRNLKKGNLSILHIYKRSNKICSTLVFAGIQVSVDELFLHAHRGLPSEYDTITSALTGSVRWENALRIFSLSVTPQHPLDEEKKRSLVIYVRRREKELSLGVDFPLKKRRRLIGFSLSSQICSSIDEYSQNRHRELKKQREMAAAAKEKEKKTYNSTTNGIAVSMVMKYADNIVKIEKDGYQWRNMNAEMVTWTELEPEYLTNSSDE
ncbi:hypothetical protein KY290_007703 [Solanum tuberosum]|uniref:Uncharacterized protein n=1 Tax=Solanum tuberosum TaxID=4113 RepID=A0ABQ7W6G0_SOLTU|nr:hypothetical protein KY290_007703 [Solanum tuberosum]